MLYRHSPVDASNSVLLVGSTTGGIVKEAVAALNNNFIGNLTLFVLISTKLTEIR